MFSCTFCERIPWYGLHSSLDIHWANLDMFFPHEVLFYCHFFNVICWISLNCNIISYLRLGLPSCTFLWRLMTNILDTQSHTHSHPCLLRVFSVSKLPNYSHPTSSDMGIEKLWIFLPCGIWHLYFILSFLGPNIFLGCRHSIQFMSWLV
jgi:hypothetical protein